MVVFGEISLSGEIRPVNRMESRMKEARKLGFDAALAPAQAAESGILIVNSVSRLAEAVQRIDDRAFSSQAPRA
jgi:DNA repair protein RadA/Sms